MKILGLESSGMVAGVAVVEDGRLLAEYSTNYKKTHSQTLLPMLDELKSMIDLDLKTIDAIAISAGPGSFTGLRIGSATAKGLGLALNIPIVEISTLEGLAYNFWGSENLICPIMDARRNQVYTGVYEFLLTRDKKPGEQILLPEAILAPCAIEIDKLIDFINETGRKVIFLGDGVPVYHKTMEDRCRVPYYLAAPHQNNQRAAGIATLGEVYYKKGRVVTAGEHQPEYLRKSQAEREREEQIGK